MSDRFEFTSNAFSQLVAVFLAVVAVAMSLKTAMYPSEDFLVDQVYTLCTLIYWAVIFMRENENLNGQDFLTDLVMYIGGFAGPFLVWLIGLFMFGDVQEPRAWLYGTYWAFIVVSFVMYYRDMFYDMTLGWILNLVSKIAAKFTSRRKAKNEHVGPAQIMVAWTDGEIRLLDQLAIQDIVTSLQNAAPDELLVVDDELNARRQRLGQ